ncbi:hypothetical protein HDV00_000423 [Rhizophlyctis rosea]|nr:hypothetical protein HDV00_000423 [Rhizophlyctis rosea]
MSDSQRNVIIPDDAPLDDQPCPASLEDQALVALQGEDVNALRNLIDTGLSLNAGWEFEQCRKCMPNIPEDICPYKTWSMFMIAAYNAHTSILELLFEKTNDQTESTEDALLVAALRLNHSICHLLLIDCTVQYAGTGYPTSYLERVMSWVAERRALDALQCLISCSIQIARYLEDVDSILGRVMGEAARRGDREVVRWIFGSRPGLAGSLKGALILAAGSGHLDVVVFLLELKRASMATEGDTPKEDDFFRNLLTPAIQAGDKEILKFLISFVRDFNDPDILTENLSNAVGAAEDYNQLPLLQYLVEQGACIPHNLMHRAAELGHLDTVQYLFDLPPEVIDGDTVEGPHQISPLDIINIAAKNGNLPLVQYLLPMCKERNEIPDWAFDLAAENGHLDTVKYLLENADVPENGRGMLGAAAAGHFEVVDHLISRAEDLGLFPEIIPEEHTGYTIDYFLYRAIQDSAQNGHVAIVNRLLLLNRTPDKEKDDALCSAASGYLSASEWQRGDFVDLLRVLLSYGASPERIGHEYGREQVDQALLGVKVEVPAQSADARHPKRISGWECKDGRSEHGYFISYRVSADHDIANLFRNELQELGIHIYVDQHCLIEGKSWQEGFMQGLFHSKTILLLCSAKSLLNIRWAHIKPDNMLLEWEHALRLNERNDTTIIPIFISDSDGPFTSYSTHYYASQVHSHPASPRLNTVWETMTALFAVQGLHLRKSDGIEGVKRISASITSQQNKVEQAVISALASLADNIPDLNDLGACVAATERMEGLLDVLRQRTKALQACGNGDLMEESLVMGTADGNGKQKSGGHIRDRSSRLEKAASWFGLLMRQERKR